MLTDNTKAILIVLAAVLLSLFLRLDVFTLPIQGKDTWRQTKTAWNIRYFVRQDANIFNPREAFLNDGNNILRYEFPMMQWSIAMVQRVTGEHIIVMRSMIFLISLFTLYAVFKIGLLFTDNNVIAALGVWIFTFLPTFFYHATSIMPDVLALCFGMYYVYFFFRHLKSGKRTDLLYAALFISLAGLAKLPFVLLGFLSVLRAFEILMNKQTTRWRDIRSYASVKALALLPVIGWYALVIPEWKGNNIQDGFMNNFVGWPLFIGFLKNHIFVNFPLEILNLSALALLFIGIFYLLKTNKLFFTKPMYFFIPLLVLFVYFFYILNVIREGHEYYLMPFYPVFLLAILYGMQNVIQWKGYGKMVIGILLLVMPFLCWRREMNKWDIQYAYFNQDFFLCRDELEKIGTPDELAVFINDQSGSILPYIADKSGYIFWNDHLPVDWLKGMYSTLGARYLYSDSRIIEAQEGFSDCVSETLLECGSLKVFRLKPSEDIK